MEYKIDIEKRIEFIEQDLILARNRVKNLKANLKEALQEMAFVKWGVKPGVVVRDVSGKPFRVVEVEPYENSRPGIKGNPRKNFGEWSKAVQYVYGWTVVE
jgi:hypothetical protein